MIKRILLVFAFFGLIAIAGVTFAFTHVEQLLGSAIVNPEGTRDFRTLKVNGKEIQVEVVSTPEDVARGLSGHEVLADDEGMLFVFDRPAIWSFWMKEMKFPLDILWIADGRVVEIAQDMQPPANMLSLPQTHRPAVPADMVLEIRAGLAETYGFTTGTEIGIDH